MKCILSVSMVSYELHSIQVRDSWVRKNVVHVVRIQLVHCTIRQNVLIILPHCLGNIVPHLFCRGIVLTYEGRNMGMVVIIVSI